jgi:hypothetical protein
VRVGFEILKSLGLRTRGCASCPARPARQGFDVIKTVEALESRLSHIKTPLSLSVLGCVVNGPGEARETDIGLTGGGNGKHMVYLSGVTDHTVQSEDMLEHIVKLVEAKAAELEAAKVETEAAEYPLYRFAILIFAGVLAPAPHYVLGDDMAFKAVQRHLWDYSLRRGKITLKSAAGFQC